jgi:hypothetical protein
LEPSPPLARLFGAVGFVALGLLTAHAGRRLLGLDADPWDQPEWDFKTVAVMVAAFLAGLLGMGFGAALGLSIRVRSERVDYALAAAWHYLANGSVAAFLTWSVVLVGLFGKDGSKQFVRDFGPWKAAGASLGLSIAACVAIAVVFSALGLISPRRRLRFVPSLVLVLPLTLPLAYAQFLILGLESRSWIAVGVAVPAVAILFSGPFIARDRRLRRQTLDHPGGPCANGP